jgi:hypothetical protein
MKYWKEVSRIAFKETVSTLRLNSFVGWLLGAISFLVLFIFLYITAPSNVVINQLLTRLLLSFVPIAAFPFVFTWHLIGEPPKAYWHLRDWTKELEEAILEAQNTDTALHEISERYQRGLALFEQGKDTASWESEFDAFIRSNFDAGLFLQMCAPSVPQRGYTTIQRDGGPLQVIRHPPPSEYDRVEAKLQKIASLMPYAGMHYRGRTINTLDFVASLIRMRGLPEHQDAQNESTAKGT